MDQHTRIAQDLVREATSQDESRRSGALSDLEAFVGMYPANLDYRGAYAFCLALSRDCAKARTQAEELERLDTGTHVVAHTLGQVYLICGDLVSARRHARRSLNAALSSEDRQDALNLIQRIDDQA